jgi:DNA adenine methylase
VNGVPTFLKWAGGKSQLIEQYKKYFPKKFNRYFEPFLGSGAIFFFVKKHFNPKEVFLSDNNEELINTFIVVRDKVEELIESLKERKKHHNKEYFYEVRREKPKELSDIERASRFIYLNKTCFNGLYRVNSKGEFNVPLGDYKNPSIFDEKVLREASKLLKNVEIGTLPFENVLNEAKKGDFIYFDPPYFPISKTSSFTSYTKDTFLEKEQKELAGTFKELHKRGCFVMLSNSNSHFIKELYKDFCIHIIKARRAISCIGTKRGKINELLITNYNTKNLKDFIKKN